MITNTFGFDVTVQRCIKGKNEDEKTVESGKKVEFEANVKCHLLHRRGSDW